MTAQRQTRVPRRRPPAGERRKRAVYGIMTLDVDARGIPIPGAAPVVGYIGQSRQTVWQREQQHRDEQPFSDLIVGGSWTIEEGWWTQQQLDEREQHYIRRGVSLLPGQEAQRPKYNIDCNRENRDRIKPWDAVAHRQAREPGWVKPAKGSFVSRQRTYGPPQNMARAVRRRPRFRWTRRRIRAAVLTGVWLVLFAGFWWAGWDVWHGWDGPRNAAIGTTVVMASAAAAWQWASKPQRRRRRRSRR
ncbi:hypothetical protein ACGFIW_01595 [Micromonospora sp. NPDC048935]|uniref:hypothetical protein n=1 Tax=Micromonospora sp. NPDC048935 TaxID=3364262 RepID=UPI00371D0DC7